MGCAMNICKHCFRFIRQIGFSQQHLDTGHCSGWFHIGLLKIPNSYCAMMSSKPLPKGSMSDLQEAEPLFRIRRNRK